MRLLTTAGWRPAVVVTLAGDEVRNGCAGCCVSAAVLCWQPVGQESKLAEALLVFFFFSFFFPGASQQTSQWNRVDRQRQV